MSSNLHKTYDVNFKLKAALAAIKNDRPIEDLSKEFDVAISQIYAWKKQLEEQGGMVFADKRKPENQNVSNEKKLQETIEKVTAERDFLARVLSH
jgi:transposase-like protein